MNFAELRVQKSAPWLKQKNICFDDILGAWRGRKNICFDNILGASWGIA